MLLHKGSLLILRTLTSRSGHFHPEFFLALFQLMLQFWKKVGVHWEDSRTSLSNSLPLNRFQVEHVVLHFQQFLGPKKVDHVSKSKLLECGS